MELLPLDQLAAQVQAVTAQIAAKCETPESNATKTYKVKSAKGVHVYFRGARKTTKLYADGQVVGDVKSTGGYVLAAGSVHPDGPVYTIIDNSGIAPLPERIDELTRHDSPSVIDDHAPIISGTRNTTLTHILGKARQLLAMDK